MRSLIPTTLTARSETPAPAMFNLCNQCCVAPVVSEFVRCASACITVVACVNVYNLKSMIMCAGYALKIQDVELFATVFSTSCF